MTESLKFMFNLYRIQLRMIFGPKHRFRKEYDEALDVLGERGHWLYLYDSLEGPKGDQVCMALKKWIAAYQAKRDFIDPELGDPLWGQVLAQEQQLKRDVHVLIYGEFTEGVHGYVSE
jgi:hypothetical protein